MTEALVAMPGGWELVLIVLVIILLFGARKLPELARGTGQALRIFKSETKGLTDDDDDKASGTTGTNAAGTTGDTAGTTARPSLEARQVEDGAALRDERRDTTNG